MSLLTLAVVSLYTRGMDIADIKIIYQDHYLLIVNKPAGVVIHPTYKHADDTLWDALLAYLEQQGQDDWQPPVLADEPAWELAPSEVRAMLRQRRTERYWREEGLLPRPCLLHRLDKDTSGIVALARTELARRHIVRQFHDHTIVKRYLAVVQKGACDWAQPRTALTITRCVLDGEEPWAASQLFASAPGDEFVLHGPLWRDPDDRRRCVVIEGGQEAITKFRVLAIKDDCALLDVRPVTGRSHQIRAHLAALGYAIVGDQTYALPSAPDKPAAALSRQFLHAYSLTLRDYPHNLPITFMAPLANDLVAWLERYYPTLLARIDEQMGL
jgi:23S rRNA pseudouridine1911/1915/1917 synthase